MDQSRSPQGTRYGVPARRKEITDQLSEAYSNNMLEQREFESRLERAEAASTIEELEAIVADFNRTGPTSQPGTNVSTEPVRHFSVLGNQSHVLIPGAAETFRAFSVLGDITVDVRAFRGSGRTLTVHVSGALGNSRVKVPAGAKVVRKATTFLGDFRTISTKEPGSLKKFLSKVLGRFDAAPASPFPSDGPPPTVILEGFRLLGDVIVEEDRR
jgi:hypothetical protein